MRRRTRFYWLLLSPALAVLTVVTIVPFLFLLSTSLTPLNLARPATWWDFSAPLANFVELLGDHRFLDSLGVQFHLSIFTEIGRAHV